MSPGRADCRAAAAATIASVAVRCAAPSRCCSLHFLALTLPLHSCLPASRSIPLFSALAGGLFVISGFMLALYLPAATHLKKLRMGAAGEAAGPHRRGQLAGQHCKQGAPTPPHHLLAHRPGPPPTCAGDLVTLVAEALDGLGVIQAFNKQGYFTQVTSVYVDNAHRSLFAAESLNLWLAFFCDFYGAAMVSRVLPGSARGGCHCPAVQLQLGISGGRAMGGLKPACATVLIHLLAAAAPTALPSRRCCPWPPSALASGRLWAPRTSAWPSPSPSRCECRWGSCVSGLHASQQWRLAAPLPACRPSLPS